MGEISFNIVQGSVGKIEWCKFGVTRAVYSCFRFLVELRHDWEYYQVGKLMRMSWTSKLCINK
jgi:hypothetical protein